jgi:hypothetical protein
MITGRMPPPMAWTIRKATRVLKPPARPQSAEPAPKPSSEMMYSLLSPKRALSQLLSGTTTPRVSV